MKRNRWKLPLALGLAAVLATGGWLAWKGTLPVIDTILGQADDSRRISGTPDDSADPVDETSAPAGAEGADGQSGFRLGDRLDAPPGRDAPTAAGKPGGPDAPGTTAGPFESTTWNMLLPRGWDPMKDFSSEDLSELEDADPRATAALERLRAIWDKAPVDPALDGARIRIPGFLVPLDSDDGKMIEFLLVPYFGACIHTPAPPANQIIHVRPRTPVAMQMMAPVWVSGTLEASRSDTAMGAAGYRMRAELVEEYRE
jgi:hypothetical protein